jgi:hypothetical protein
MAGVSTLTSMVTRSLAPSPHLFFFFMI